MDFRIQGVIELQNRVGEGVRGAVGSLNELNDVVFNQWWGLQNIAGAFAAVGGAATAAMGMAAKEAIAWEESMADLERTVRSVGEYDWAAAENLQAIEGGLRDVAASSPIAVSELAAIATQAGQLGVASGDIASFTKTVSELAYVTTLSSEEAAYAFARIAGIMEVPQTQYENLGSVILELGRGSASTETEITNFATRMAGTAKVAGLTADEVLALGSSMANLGIRAERGSTAMQRTLFQMMEAVGQGGEELEIFAQTAGRSASEFAELWRSDPAEAITLFIEGLDAFGKAGGNADQILERLGMSGIRQKEVLLALAGASSSMVNANVRVRNSFDLAANSMEDGTAMAEIISQRYATFAAQLGMLRNRISEVKEMFGSQFLPILQWGVTLVGYFVDGMQAVPGPIRGIITVMGVFIAGVGGLAAAVFGLVPRLVMMRHTIQTLATTGQVATAGTHALTQAQNMNALAAQRVAVAQRGAAAANQATGTSAAAAAAGTVAAGRASQTLAKGAMFATRAIGWVGAAMAVLSIGTTIYGAVAGRANRETEILGEAQMDLVQIMQGAQGNIDNASRAWIQNQLIMANATGVAKALGVEVEHLINLVSGMATQSEFNAFEEQMKSAGGQGEQLLETIKQLHRNYQASADAARITTNYNEEMTESFDDLSSSIDKSSDALEKQRREQEMRNEAFLAYGDAVLSQKRAQFALADAQDAYNKALKDAKNPAKDLRELEWRVRDARWAVRDATRSVAEAEYKLRNARANQRRDLQDAEWDLADARYRYLDSLESVKDKEQELRDLRAGPTADQMRDAIIKLEKAQVSLLKANQKVADSEWYLQYLREEGASERDIKDAELILAESRVDAKEASAELSDSEKELAKLRRGPDAEEIAKAERELAKARRDSQKALRNIADYERQVRQLRNDIAKDTAYKDAQRELEKANYDLQKATYALSKAQDDLRSHSPANVQRDLAKAQLEVEEAAYALAKANVEVRKQTALMNGEAWSAGHSARALAEELGKLGSGLPRDVANNLAKVSSVLRRAIPTFEKDIKDGLDDLGKGITGPGGMGDMLGDIMGGELAELDLDDDVEGFWDKLQRQFESWGWLKGAGIGASIGLIFGPVGAAIGGLIGLVIGAFMEFFFEPVRKWLDDKFGTFFTWFGDIFREGWSLDKIDADLNNGARELGRRIRLWFSDLGYDASQAVGRFLDRWNESMDSFQTHARAKFIELGEEVSSWGWYQMAENWGDSINQGLRTLYSKLDWWGTEARSKLGEAFGNIGRGVKNWWRNAWNWGNDIAEGLGEGIKNAYRYVRDGFKNLWDRFVNTVKGWLGIKSPSTVFAGFGADLIRGLAKGLRDKVGDVLTFARELPGRIASAMGNLASWTIGKGRDAIIGLRNGFSERWQNFRSDWLNPLGSYLSSSIGSAAGWLKAKGRDVIGGLWGGFSEKYRQFQQGALWKLVDWVYGSVGNFYKNMLGKGRDIISGVWNGMVDKWNAMKNRFYDFGSSIASYVGGVFKFGSPSKLTTQWGAWIIDGLLKGLGGEKSKLVRMMDEITELMVPKDLGTMAANYQPTVGSLKSGALQQALGSIPAQLMAQLTQRQGDNISVTAQTNADPFAIAEEVAWGKRIRTRN